MTKRYALRDDQWERIKDLLPGRAGQPGAWARDNRFVDAVLSARFKPKFLFIACQECVDAQPLANQLIY